MQQGKDEKRSVWERTNVTNLLRHKGGGYYARVKIGGKQKWRSLETNVLSVAKLRLGDAEKEMRAQAFTASSKPSEPPSGVRVGEYTVGRFMDEYRRRSENEPSLKASSKGRRIIAIKAIEKTWPELASRDIRRVSANDCREWAARAIREGTGFVAPKAKTIRAGMSASAFNKATDALRAVFEIAREQGVIYQNPAADISKAKMKKKALDLPSAEKFAAIVRNVASAGARQSKDCADMVRLLAYSGTRLQEAIALRWGHVDFQAGRLKVPGTKSESSQRVIPLFPPLKALLEEIKARRVANGVECGVESPILAVSECKQALANACALAGVKRLTHHDLRHLFATRCIELGVDIPTVSRWLGHSDGGALAMRTYGHLRQEHSEAMAKKISF